MKKRQSISVRQAADPGTSANPLATTQRKKITSPSEMIIVLRNSVDWANERKDIAEKVISIVKEHIEKHPMNTGEHSHIAHYMEWFEFDLESAQRDLKHLGPVLARFEAEQKTTQKENNKKTPKHN